MRFLTKRVIYNDNEPYLIRYTIFSCKWFGIFIHNILRSDRDRDLHDHPWNFWTFILKGGYYEQTFKNDRVVGRWHGAGSLIKHKATDAHRLVLRNHVDWDSPDLKIKTAPVWTLFIHGRRLREWGFYTPGGWVKWQEYLI